MIFLGCVLQFIGINRLVPNVHRTNGEIALKEELYDGNISNFIA